MSHSPHKKKGKKDSEELTEQQNLLKDDSSRKEKKQKKLDDFLKKNRFGEFQGSQMDLGKNGALTGSSGKMEDPVGEDAKRGPVKKHRRVSLKEFSAAALHHRFEQHVSKAQEAFLQGKSTEAEEHATRALAIRPTAHLFAFLAVLAESKGQYDRACDFRLLQAFLAKDRVLWEELLEEFLSQQLFFKSAVVLQRLSALEKDPKRYRELQLQLADLLVGLGEIRRAVSVLVPLWENSECEDFEVFAILAGLYFQLGKWVPLERLIESSLRFFGVVPLRPSSTVGVEPQEGEGTHGLGWGVSSPTESSEPGKRRRRRIKFVGVNEENEEVGSPNSFGETDENGVGSSLRMYGETTMALQLETPSKKKSFLVLINVHTELLNERGKFADTIELTKFAAACLQVDLLDLPVDVLFRYGTACAFHGGVMQQPCRDVFQHLLQQCSMEDYSDVLMDAAANLSRAGMWDLAKETYQSFTRYYTMELEQQEKALEKRLQWKQGHIFNEPSHDAPEEEKKAYTAESRQGQQEIEELQKTCQDLRVILAEAYYGLAKCAAAAEDALDFEEAAVFAKEAVRVYPAHLNARLLLGKHYYYDLDDLPKAVDVLTPLTDEPAIQRVQLGASLVAMFRSSSRFVEAIALGVSIFNLILSTPEDGDTESVAPGSSAASSRRTINLRLPSLSRASSAIVPAASLSGMLYGPTATSGQGSLARSVASSIRSAGSVFRQQLGRRGHGALTTTVYGASAAQSVAAGWEREMEQEKLKDSSTIFRFNRKRKRKEDVTEAGQQGHKEESGDASAEVAATRQRRRKEMETLPPEAFWKEEEGAKKDEDQAKAPEGEPVVPEMGNATALDEREADLRELEAYEEELLERRRARLEHSGEEGVGEGLPDLIEEEEEAVDAALPTLEEVSEQFEDKEVAQLFLEATMGSWNRSAMQHESAFGINTTQSLRQLDVSGSPEMAGAVGGEGSGMQQQALSTVSAREVVQVLGRFACMELASHIMECYRALNRFSEAKNFAALVLARFSGKRQSPHHRHNLERPLRLALLHASISAGESEDAYHVGLRLLQEDSSEEDRREVLELMHGVLSRCEDRSSILFRHIFDGNDSPALLVLLANRYFQTRSYRRALNLYLSAHSQRPQDVFLVFVIAVLYFLCSHQKHVKAQEACVTAGLYFFKLYQERMLALLPTHERYRLGEVLYNTARAFQYLSQPHLCVPLYERVGFQLRAPEECTVALQRAARFNLYFLYRWTSENEELALASLSKGPAPSPFAQPPSASEGKA